MSNSSNNGIHHGSHCRRHLWRLRKVDADIWSLQTWGNRGTRAHQRGHRHSWLSRDTSWPINRAHFTWLRGFRLGLFESLGGRSLSSKRDDILSPDDDKPKCSFDLLMHSCLIGLRDPVLLCISEDNVHVFVEGKEGANHHAAILNGDTDSEVNPL